MSVSRQEWVQELATLLNATRFKDYCPNGLQVEGRATVRHLVTGVTASEALIEAALAQGADALLVHHGFFWKGESPVITGPKKRRLSRLLAADVSLAAFHLPLDHHDTLGNNAQWAARLGWRKTHALFPHDPWAVGDVGVLPMAMTVADLCAQIERLTQRPVQWISGGAETPVTRVAWCTGAAQGFIEQAAEQGAQVYVSGEISEPTVHAAREWGMHYLAVGHHASERYGVQALGDWCAQRWGLQHTFIDIDNPV